MAETTNKPIYFFRFEDVLADPSKELKEIFRFILGIQSIEGTVIEHRIEEVMKWSAEKNQTYKPRQGGVNKNLKNYTAEQYEYMKQTNEEIFHILGYAKDEREDNITPFIDYEGKAKLENVAKINYFKKLNEVAW